MGTLNNRCRVRMGTPKRTIILRTSHLVFRSEPENRSLLLFWIFALFSHADITMTMNIRIVLLRSEELSCISQTIYASAIRFRLSCLAVFVGSVALSSVSFYVWCLVGNGGMDPYSTGSLNPLASNPTLTRKNLPF